MYNSTQILNLKEKSKWTTNNNTYFYLGMQRAKSEELPIHLAILCLVVPSLILTIWFYNRSR